MTMPSLLHVFKNKYLTKLKFQESRKTNTIVIFSYDNYFHVFFLISKYALKGFYSFCGCLGLSGFQNLLSL